MIRVSLLPLNYKNWQQLVMHQMRNVLDVTEDIVFCFLGKIKWLLLVLFANWKVFRCRHPLFKYKRLQVEHQLLIIYIFKLFWTTYQSLPKNKKIKISAEYPENLCHFTEQACFCKNTQPTTNYLSNFWILLRIISFG